MAHIFITGSADGLGLGAAKVLHSQGHKVVVHARSQQRLHGLENLLETGAQAVIGDLSDLEQMKDIAAQVNAIGKMDAVIHNAGVYSGPQILPVNVVAPYVLTALIKKPQRLIYLSSGMHLSGNPNFDGLDWAGRRATSSYSDTKLFVTAFAFAMARLWPDVVSSAVNPGWVPTKMGGAGAPDDLRLGHLTQEWLATSDDPKAVVTGQYWFHQKVAVANPSARNIEVQRKLIAELEKASGVHLTETKTK